MPKKEEIFPSYFKVFDSNTHIEPTAELLDLLLTTL